MLKLLCPLCYKSVSIPETAAGTDAPCPECGKSFAIPAKYNPTVAPAPMPLPAPPPAPTLPPPPPRDQSLVPTVPEPAAPLPVGYTHSRGFSLSPCVVGWIPTVSLTAILLLTLLPWVEVAPGGHPVYTQGAWRAITGRPTQNIQLEDLMLKELPPPTLFDRTTSDWFLMLPYIIALIVAVVVAWADRLDSRMVSDRLPTLWPYRHLMVASLAGAALLLLAIELARGFGLERAVSAAVSDKFAAQRQQAGATAGDLKKIDFYESQELAKYGLERTGWFCVVMVLHALALLTMLASYGLHRRGNKPPPRIVLQY